MSTLVIFFVKSFARLSVAGAFASTLLWAQTPTGPAGMLAELTAVAKGDMAALQLNFYAPARWRVSLDQYGTDLFSYFDRTAAKIVVELYGLKETVPDAQATITQFQGLILTDFVPFFKNNYGIEISKLNDLRIVYRNRSEEGQKKLLYWEEGKFKYPVD